MIPAGTYHNADWEFRANTNRSAPLSASGVWDPGGFYSGTQFGPTFALGSWIAFKQSGPNEVVAMGDLVLTEAELNAVLSRLQEATVIS